MLSGTPHRRIAAHFDLAETSVRRHRRSHLPQAIVASRRALEITRAGDLVDRLVALANEADAVLDQAKRDGDRRAAIGAIAAATRLVDLQARMLGEMNEQQAQFVDVTVNEAFTEIRDDMVRALEQWPEARSALAQVMIAHAERARQQEEDVAP